MKTLVKFLAVLTVLAFSFAPSAVRAQDAPPPPDAQNAPPPPDDQGGQSDLGASFQTFYDQLGDQGTWVQTDDYGYVFQPNVTDPNWAPYTDGHWVYTDDGWTWVSDEPWGWATYHYGRWANIDGMGWIWVPGYRWAPAWVSWRYGGGYCGWAPLPPGTFIGVDYAAAGGFHFGGDVDVSFGIGPGFYNFVRVGDMGEPNYRGHFLDRSRNYTVINNTTNITNINIAGGGGAGAGFQGVVARGPLLSDVNAHSRQHISTVQLTASNQPGRSNLQGNSLAVYAPRVNGAAGNAAKPARVAQTISHPTFNRGDSITKPLAVTANVRPPAPTPEAIQAAQTAQLHAPAKAKIVTDKTPVRTTLTQPLTSMQPVAQTHRTPNTAPTTGANGFNGANTVNPNTPHPAASAPFTGEPTTPPVTHQKKEVQPQTEATPSATHPAASAPFTGEPATPPATHHTQPQVQPQTEATPPATHHTQPQVQPQTEATPPATHHTQPQTDFQPAPTYHPQAQTPPPAAQTYHPQQEQPQHQQQQAQPQQQVQHQQQPQPQPQAQHQPQPKQGGGTNNAPGH